MTEPVHIEPRTIGRRASDHEDLPHTLKTAIKEAMYEVLRDPELSAAFWKRGYQELTSHAGNSASQWIGRRILTAVMTALLVFTVGYLVKTGALK